MLFMEDELKQWELQQKYPKDEYPNLDFPWRYWGLQRLKMHLKNWYDFAALLKQVSAASTILLNCRKQILLDQRIL